MESNRAKQLLFVVINRGDRFFVSTVLDSEEDYGFRKRMAPRWRSRAHANEFQLLLLIRRRISRLFACALTLHLGISSSVLKLHFPDLQRQQLDRETINNRHLGAT